MDLGKPSDYVNSKGQFDFQKLSYNHEYKTKRTRNVAICKLDFE